MAARRLILAMIVVLVVASIAAALVPVSRDVDETTSSTVIEAADPTGRLVTEELDADAAKPKTIAIKLGDQLVLRVISTVPDQVEIPGLGELADVERDEPARFDLMPFETGRYVVRLVDARNAIGYIVVRRRGAAGAPERSTDSPGESTTGSTAGARSAS